MAAMFAVHMSFIISTKPSKQTAYRFHKIIVVEYSTTIIFRGYCCKEIRNVFSFSEFSNRM